MPLTLQFVHVIMECHWDLRGHKRQVFTTSTLTRRQDSPVQTETPFITTCYKYTGYYLSEWQELVFFLLQLNCLLFIFFFSSSHYTCRFPSLTFLSGRVFNQEIIVHTVLAGLPTTRLSRLSASRSMGTQGIITIRCGLRQLLEGQYSAGPGNEPNYWRFHVLPLARSSWKALPKLCNYSRRNFKINAK